MSEFPKKYDDYVSMLLSKVGTEKPPPYDYKINIYPEPAPIKSMEDVKKELLKSLYKAHPDKFVKPSKVVKDFRCILQRRSHDQFDYEDTEHWHGDWWDEGMLFASFPWATGHKISKEEAGWIHCGYPLKLGGYFYRLWWKEIE